MPPMSEESATSCSTRTKASVTTAVTEDFARPAPEAPKKRLGEVLIELGILSEEGLERALELQKVREARLGEILVTEGIVEQIGLVRALAHQYGVEFVDLDDVKIDRRLADRLPHALAQRHRALPIRSEGDSVVVAMENPLNIVALDDVRLMLGSPVRAVMVERQPLSDAIGRSASADEQMHSALRLAPADSAGTNDKSGIGEGELAVNDAPIIKFVDLLLSRAVRDRESDIHIEPMSVGTRVRFRIDGVLREVMHPPAHIHAGLVSRIKVMAQLDIAEQRVPHDGRVSLDIGDRMIDVRVAISPTVHGEAVVLRILRHDDGPSKVADLGMEPDQLAKFQSTYRRPWGLVLVTGPTGSGKTTTLYSVLKELNDPSRNVMTVEYRMDGIKQMQVKPKVRLTFASALRSMLRSDPDVVLVGEIRDKETAVMAVEASLTGHLVLASIHTNDAASTPIRLIEMGVQPYLVTAGLRGVLAQRLARRLCEECKQPEPDSPGTAAVGCDRCTNGYKGRFALTEFMPITDAIGQLILDKRPTTELAATAVAEGMATMRDFAQLRVDQGVTSPAELERAIGWSTQKSSRTRDRAEKYLRIAQHRPFPCRALSSGTQRATGPQSHSGRRATADPASRHRRHRGGVVLSHCPETTPPQGEETQPGHQRGRAGEPVADRSRALDRDQPEPRPRGDGRTPMG
jgi:type IV pilus assembly protein PilB